MDLTEFQNLGIAVIPVIYRTKIPAVAWREYQQRQPTQHELDIWFRSGHQTNAAVICGWHGLTVLDFDTTLDYLRWQLWALGYSELARNIALRTYRVRTSRGMHVYLFVEDEPRCGHFAGGDIKGRGGYVLIPPSVHPSGTPYRAVDDAAPILSVRTLSEILPEAPPPPAPQPQPLTDVYPTSQLWPASLLEQAKAAHPILSMFAEARDTGGGRWYMAKCPFHDDEHESMWIDARRGLCGCYAGCTPQPLDAIDLYARLHGLSLKEAIREMTKELA